MQKIAFYLTIILSFPLLLAGENSYEKSKEEAEYYRKLNLARAYERGTVLKKDEKKAFFYYYRAATNWNYTEPEALEYLKGKKKGNYAIIQIDPEYVPAPLEHKQVFGVTFEQGRQELAIDDELISNIVTENKELSEEAKRDMKVSLIILKYTQSNSVCYVKDGQAIGIGAGQQSRIHCTRLAGQKADNWWLRQSPQVMGLQFKDEIRRADSTHGN